MLFMVHIIVKIPGDMPQKQKDELRERENTRAMELIKAGKMRRAWRIVGQVANFSLWEADSLEEMHANVGSLPMYPFMDVTVTPLIAHPSTEAYQKAHGALPAF
jgi:muconolactone D-isomerase